MFYLPPEAFEPGFNSCKATAEERESDIASAAYLAIEADIATAISEAVAERATECEASMDEAVGIGSEFAIHESLAECEHSFDDLFSVVEATVGASIVAAVAAGEGLISENILRGVPSRAQVIRGMIQSTKYYTNEFFNTQVVPAMVKEIDKVLLGTSTFGKPNFRSVQTIMEKRLRTVPYWRVVANAAASRSFHYGYLKAAQFQGMTAFRFEAVIDDVTSQICSNLDGTVWNIADAVNLVERTAKAEDPEEVKALQPWLTWNDIKDLDPTALRDLGVMVPPLHGNCRSTIVPF
jgi:hypothetical protein